MSITPALGNQFLDEHAASYTGIGLDRRRNRRRIRVGMPRHHEDGEGDTRINYNNGRHKTKACRLEPKKPEKQVKSGRRITVERLNEEHGRGNERGAGWALPPSVLLAREWNEIHSHAQSSWNHRWIQFRAPSPWRNRPIPRPRPSTQF